MLLIGTNEGIYRASLNAIDDATHVLDTERVMRVRRFGGTAFAATQSGLFRSTDGGATWTDLGVPRDEVYSIRPSLDGERLYAGTHPAHLYVSSDDGESWQELTGLQELPSREEWRLPRHRNKAHVRSLGIHPDAPERIVAGIEVGGVHVSDVHESEALVSQPERSRSGDDGGDTWTERRDGLHDDVHHVLVRGAEEYVASCGGGLYRTRDAGRSWTRLDTDVDHTYFREAFVANGRLYAAAARSSPPSWDGEHGADAALFESPDGGDTLDSVSYPGEPEEFVLAWSALDEDGDEVLAGTRGGHVLRRTGGEWTRIGSVPATVRSLSVTSGSA